MENYHGDGYFSSFKSEETMWFEFFCEVSNIGTVLREELIREISLLKQAGFYSVNACQAFSDWFSRLPRKHARLPFSNGFSRQPRNNAYLSFSDWFSSRRRKPGYVGFLFGVDESRRLDNDYKLAKDDFYTLAKDDEFKDLCWTIYSWYKSDKQSRVLKGHADAMEEGLVVDGDGVIPVPKKQHFDFSFLFPGLMGSALFDFFCDACNDGTVLREEVISGFLQLKQSRFYSVSVCQAFSDWFIFSRLPRKRRSIGPSLKEVKYGRLYNDYELAKAHFYTLANDDEFLSLCYSLHRWYKSGKKSSGKPLNLVPFDKRLVAESGVLKGHAVAIEEGLVVDGDGVIPVPNVSSYVLSQVILFLEKKHHFQEAVHTGGAHFEGWSTAFFNRNNHILPDLEQAGQDLQIPSLLESISKVQKRQDGRRNDNLSSEVYHYLCGMAGNNHRSIAILGELKKIQSKGLDEVACEKFRTWFSQISHSGRDHHNEFKTLMKSPDFSQVCLSLYWGEERVRFPEVSLRSCDGKVLKIDKRVAIDESVVLRRCVRSSNWWNEIPVTIASHVLSSIIGFCHNAWDFHKIYGSRQLKEALAVVDHFRESVTEFLKSNIDMLSELYEAADFLEIPSLLLLTTEEVTDLVTRPLDKASVLSGKLSFSRILSSLLVKFTE